MLLHLIGLSVLQCSCNIIPTVKCLPNVVDYELRGGLAIIILLAGTNVVGIVVDTLLCLWLAATALGISTPWCIPSSASAAGSTA